MADNNHNLDGIQAPALEETTYDPSKSAKRSLDGIQAPTLEDTTYIPEKRNSGLNDVVAPTLSDTYTPGVTQPQTNPQFQQYGTPQPQVSQQFQQYGASQQPHVSQQFQQYGASQQPHVSQQFQQYGASQQPHVSQQFQQYGASLQPQASQQFQQYGAPLQPQASQQFQQYGASQQPQASQQFQQYGAPLQPQKPERSLDDVQKPMLDDEPPVQERYVPKFVDPDLEAAKKQAVDRAIKSSLNSVPDSFDEEKSREAYRAFMREKDADLAKKGGIYVIILMILGMISGLLTLLYSFGSLKDTTPEILDTFNMIYMIMGVLFLVGGGIMLVKSKSTQKIAANIFTIGTILHVIPGVFLMLSKESRGSAIPMYIAILILNIIVCFVYGSSEPIKKHYNGHGRDDYY